MKNGIVSIFSALIGAIIGAIVVNKVANRKINKVQEMSNKHFDLFLMMDQWIQIKQRGKSLEKYLEEHNYKDIAIYGMSYAGERLLEEFRDSNITVKYGIDKMADRIYADIDVVSPEDSLEKVDAVIVTAISFMEEIEETLSAKLSCPILSLEDILCEIV